jgi:hypothetical protein
MKKRKKKAPRSRRRGLLGLGVARSPAELINILAKRAPGGMGANVSRIYLGLKKGCFAANRVRAHCKARPEILPVSDARHVLDALAKAAGIPGSTDYQARGQWEGASEPSVVFEALHVGEDGLANFQSKMNAIARGAAQRTCQDAAMVVHMHGSGKATVDFVSYLGKKSSQDRKRVC